MKALGRKTLEPFLGKKRSQRVFELLYDVSLAGMNFGEGNHPGHSGERYVMEVIAERLPKTGSVIFDVGANRGLYTRELLSILPVSARIIAFEPSPSTFRLLESNVGDEPRVQLENLGFSDSERTAKLFSPGEGSKLGSVHDTRERVQRSGMTLVLEEEIKLTTLDRYCETNGIDHIDFLKLDVEGHELSVLRGGQALIGQGKVDAVQFEFSAANVESRTFFKDFFELLSGAHFHLYRVLQDGLRPIDGYRESYEIFKRATNYVALTDSFPMPHE